MSYINKKTCEICGSDARKPNYCNVDGIITCGHRKCIRDAQTDGLTLDQRRSKQLKNSQYKNKLDIINEYYNDGYYEREPDNSLWGVQIKQMENVYNNFESHHILPKSAFPDLADDLLNGVPLPKSWHEEFHSMNGGYKSSNDPFRDWAGLLFKFIEEKIIESKLQLNTLDQWF